MIGHDPRPASQEAEVSAVHAMVERRIAAGDAYFAASARTIADCSSAMADRFFAGATLLVLGSDSQATDAQHNSVEYVHPVLPGCRALPALSLASDVPTVTGILTHGDPDDVYAHQLRALARRGDIALAFAGVPVAAAIRRALDVARDRGMLSVVLLTGSGDAELAADFCLQVDDADALVAQELHLATYHMLWELIHIVINHRGIAAKREGGA